MSERRTILVAEDDRMTRRILQYALESHPVLKDRDLEVVVAEDGEHALILFNTEQPCLVIADLFMPRLDGFALCKNIRQSPLGQSLPIIVTSAVWKQPDILDQLRDEYGVQFIAKPFDVDELVQMVEQALDRLD